MWSLDKLKAKLEVLCNFKYSLNDIQSEKLTEAAILVPIISKNGIPYILLTVRSRNLTTSPGQVCFPGGKRDKNDQDIVATALRETEEEVGIGSEHLKILGTLIPYVTRRNFHVTPVIAEVFNFEAFVPKLNPFEVCEVLIVPLKIFILKSHHKCKTFSFGKNEGTQVNVDYFEFKTSTDNIHIIWGLTALIATQVASLLFEQRPEFQYHTWFPRPHREIQRDKLYDQLIQGSKL